MKTLARTAAILIAALVVVGALSALSQTSFASSVFGGSAGAGEMMRGQMPAGIAGGHENEGSGAGIIGLLPILKNAAIMGALTLMVLMSSFILKLSRRRARPTRA